MALYGKYLYKISTLSGAEYILPESACRNPPEVEHGLMVFLEDVWGSSKPRPLLMIPLSDFESCELVEEADDADDAKKKSDLKWKKIY